METEFVIKNCQLLRFQLIDSLSNQKLNQYEICQGDNFGVSIISYDFANVSD